MIIRNSKFESTPLGHGGSKRSAQIEEILCSHGIVYENDPFLLPKRLSVYTKIQLVFRSIRFIKKNVGWKSYPTIKTKIDAIKYFSLRIPIVLDRYNGKQICFIWESTISGNYGFPYLMKSAGARIIAVPHNLESVVPSQRDSQTNTKAPDWFILEIERLKMCDVVFTISKEEAWLLRLFGINAHYLPYYPPFEACQLLLSVRNHRDSRPQNTKNKFLLFGTASNQPTRSGMQALIDAVKDKVLPFEILVAGYGTELLNLEDNHNVRFLGALSASQLRTVLYETDAVLVNQAPTSGALTKITEMLIAGVPLFVNFDSARDYFHVKDVIIYSSFDDLFDKLASFIPHQATMPARIKDYEEFFIKTVKSLDET